MCISTENLYSRLAGEQVLAEAEQLIKMYSLDFPHTRSSLSLLLRVMPGGPSSSPEFLL